LYDAALHVSKRTGTECSVNETRHHHSARPPHNLFHASRCANSLWTHRENELKGYLLDRDREMLSSCLAFNLDSVSADLNKLEDQHNCARYETTVHRHFIFRTQCQGAMESSDGLPRSRQLPCSLLCSARFGLPRIALGMLECYGLTEPSTNRREQITPPLPPVWHVCFVYAFDEWHLYYRHSSNLRVLSTTWLPVSPFFIGGTTGPGACAVALSRL
jgi:hypothetical protein